MPDVGNEQVASCAECRRERGLQPRNRAHGPFVSHSRIDVTIEPLSTRQNLPGDKVVHAQVPFAEVLDELEEGDEREPTRRFADTCIADAIGNGHPVPELVETIGKRRRRQARGQGRLMPAELDDRVVILVDDAFAPLSRLRSEFHLNDRRQRRKLVGALFDAHVMALPSRGSRVDCVTGHLVLLVQRRGAEAPQAPSQTRFVGSVR